MGNSALRSNVSDIEESHSGTAGHLQLWQIRSGISIKTKEKVSVWTFDKGDLSNTDRKGGAVTDRAQQEQIYGIMLRDMKVMQETSGLGVVKVVEILQEDKSALAFTTEPVLCSLADLMYQFDVVPDGTRKHGSVFGSTSCLSEMEISRGLGQLAEAVQVLHTVNRRLHLSLSPEAVMLAPNGVWKICSLGFSLAFEAGENSRVASPYFLKAAGSSRVRIEPDLRYLGQEVSAGGIDPPSIRYLSPASDVFSLGILFYEMYRYNLKLVPERRPHLCLLPLSSNSCLDHPNALHSVGAADMKFLPHSLAHLLESMISTQTHLRLSTSDISNHPYFATGNLAVLRAVDALPSRDVGTQGSQLLSMRSQLNDFPPRLLLSSVLPTICLVTNQNAALWVYALPLHETILARLSDKLAYRNVVADSFANGLGVINPVETMQAFLRAATFIRETFEPAFFEANVINKLLVNCFDKAHVPLQCQLFSVLCEKKVHSGVSAACMLQTIIPKSCKEACKNPDTTVKVHALYFLSHVLDRMDKAYLAQNVLPSLKYITEKDKAPQVTMTVIGIYEAMSENLGAEYISASILPTIQPFLMDRTLDKEQFTICANLVKQLLKKVVDMRCNELGMDENSLAMGSATLSGKFDYFSAARKLLDATISNAVRAAPSANPTGSVGGLGAGIGGVRPPPEPTSAPPPPPSSAPPSSLPDVPIPGYGGSNSSSSSSHVFKGAGDATQYRYDPSVDMGRHMSGSRPQQPQVLAPLKSPPTQVPTATKSTNGVSSGSAFGMDDVFGSLSAAQGSSSSNSSIGGSGGGGMYSSNASSSIAGGYSMGGGSSTASSFGGYGMGVGMGGGSTLDIGIGSGSGSGGGGREESLGEQIRRSQAEMAAAQAKLNMKQQQGMMGMSTGMDMMGGMGMMGTGMGMGMGSSVPAPSNSSASSSTSFRIAPPPSAQNSGGFAFMNQAPPQQQQQQQQQQFGGMGAPSQQLYPQNSGVGVGGGGGGFAFMNQTQPQYGMSGMGMGMSQQPQMMGGQMMGGQMMGGQMMGSQMTGGQMMGGQMMGGQMMGGQMMGGQMGMGMQTNKKKDDPFDFLN